MSSTEILPPSSPQNRDEFRARTWARFATARKIAWWSLGQAGKVHRSMQKSDWAGLKVEMPWTSVRNCDTTQFGPDGKKLGTVELRAVLGDDGMTVYSAAGKCSLRSGCPRCRGPILAQRQGEVTKAAIAHTNEGLLLGMGTFTLGHHRLDSLSKLVDVLLTAWRTVQQSEEWQGMRGGLVGTHRVLEVTTGGKDGFHPHLHVLLFQGVGGGVWQELCQDRVNFWLTSLDGARSKGSQLRAKLDLHETALDRRSQRVLWAASTRTAIDRNVRWENRCRRLLRRAEKMLVGASSGDAVAYLRAWLPQFWSDTVAELAGEAARPSLTKGCHLMGIGSESAKYVAKLADEVTREDSKDSDPFRLLDAAGDGDEEAIARWIEFTAAMHGRKVSAFGGDVVERYCVEVVSDEEAAQALRGGSVVEVLPVLGWRALLVPPSPGCVPPALARLREWETVLNRCPLVLLAVRPPPPRLCQKSVGSLTNLQT